MAVRDDQAFAQALSFMFRPTTAGAQQMKGIMDKQKKNLEILIKQMKKEGTSEEEIQKVIQLMFEIGMLAKEVKEDYENNPSTSSGGVDTEKGLVSGSGIQIHSEAIPDSDDEWELMSPKKDKKKK